jgi:hypothetical protein
MVGNFTIPVLQSPTNTVAAAAFPAQETAPTTRSSFTPRHALLGIDPSFGVPGSQCNRRRPATDTRGALREHSWRLALEGSAKSGCG